MFVIISCFRFIHAFSLILFALTMLTLPLVTNAAQDPSLARSSTVLAQGQEIRDGLTSLQAMPKGISGSFEQDGKIVYFETRRGSRTPKHLRNGDPSTPDYEIDVRFMDQDGKPFLIQIGGDAPVENTWEISTPKAKVEEEAQADFQLAAKTVGALKKLKFNKKFAHEHQALLNLASVMESAQVVEKVEGLPSQPLSATAQATGDIYRHIIQMHDKSCCLGLADTVLRLGSTLPMQG